MEETDAESWFVEVLQSDGSTHKLYFRNVTDYGHYLDQLSESFFRGVEEGRASQ